MTQQNDRSRKLYVVVSSYEYEGWSLPDLITPDREEAIDMLRDSDAPGATESYAVYEYIAGKGGQGEVIASRRRNQKLWVKPDDATQRPF